MAEDRHSWRVRLASLVAAIGTSLAVGTAATSAQANASVPQSPQSLEIHSQRRFRKLVFRRTAGGKLRVADHSSHESHASHSSHASHGSSSS